MHEIIQNIKHNIKDENDKQDKRNIRCEPIHNILKAMKNNIAVKLGYRHYNFLLLNILQNSQNSAQPAIMNRRASETE